MMPLLDGPRVASLDGFGEFVSTDMSALTGFAALKPGSDYSNLM
jgi:hypothetical protein